MHEILPARVTTMAAENSNETNSPPTSCECGRREQLERIVLGSKALNLLAGTLVALATVMTLLGIIGGSL